MRILVCNVGSTSLKYKLFEMAGEAILCHGGIDGVGSASSRLRHSAAGQTVVDETRPIADQGMAIQWMTSLLLGNGPLVPGRADSLGAIAFKVVGAERITGAVVLDDRVLEAMESHTPLLPRHNPPYIEAIRHFRALAPDVPLIGLFETSFHADMPEVAYTYGVPREWAEGLGIRRLGYHGASFTFVTERAFRIVGHSSGDIRLVACHLGGSSSICAIRNGRSVDTSMGMSNQAGVSMSNRCGDLDPFVVLFAMDRLGLSTDEVRDILTTRGGLAGMSGLSGDVRDLEQAAEAGHEGAQRALAIFAYEVKKYIGAYAAAMGGLDAVVFTGGIGENGCAMRARICEGLEFLGVEIDAVRNRVRGAEAVISPDDGRVAVIVIPTNEEIVVARSAKQILNKYAS
jgi:acetate kinase